MREEAQVLPQGYQGNSLDIIAAHAHHARADAVITLFDSWVFPNDVMSKLQGWIAWAPVDHDPLPSQIAKALRIAYQPVAYSKFGLRKMQEYVFPDGQTLEPRYIPHGIDTTLFSPKDRDKAREGLNIPELADADFMAIMVAANKGFPSRKAFPEVMAAWRIFSERHPKSLLYMHTHAGDLMRGCHIPNLLTALGVRPASVVFADQYWSGPMGYPPGGMALLYAAADVLVNPSYGEGFGIPIVEAQACGIPVIVNDCTSMPELCFAGWKTGHQPFYTGLESWQFIPRIDDILESFEAAYQARGSETLREQARAGALPYDADTVAEIYWRPFLEELEGELLAGRVEVEADPLQEAKGE